MNWKTILEGITGSGDGTNTLEHRSFTGSRFILLIGFGCLILWATKGVLTQDTMHLLFWGLVTYTAANTLTRLLQFYANMRIRMRAMELAWKDGKLDNNEAGVVNATGVEGD
jgi:hypothetical protein